LVRLEKASEQRKALNDRLVSKGQDPLPIRSVYWALRRFTICDIYGEKNVLTRWTKMNRCSYMLPTFGSGFVEDECSDFKHANRINLSRRHYGVSVHDLHLGKCLCNSMADMIEGKPLRPCRLHGVKYSRFTECYSDCYEFVSEHGHYHGFTGPYDLRANTFLSDAKIVD